MDDLIDHITQGMHSYDDRVRIANEIGLSPESVDYILNLFFKETCRRIKVVNDLTSRHAYGEARR